MTVPYESMNRKKSPCVSDCHARSLRGCKSVLLFFCILRAKRGCCGVIVVGKGNVASIGSVATPGKNACWGVPQTPKKRGETMTNRTRKIVLRVPVTPEERHRINTGQVCHQSIRIPLDGTVLTVYGNSGEISHMLIRAGELIEQCSLAAVLISRQGER